MKRFLIFATALAAACSSQPQPSRQQIAPVKIGEYSSETGPSPVGVIPVATVHDSARNKDVEISIEYPTRGGPFPVIVFSPGYSGSSQGYEPLASYWTSNGYVVIRVSHADAGALRELMRDPIREAYQQRPEDANRRERSRRQQQAQAQSATPPPFRPNPTEAIWEKEREPQWRDRAADLRLVIDSLRDLETRFPELQEKMDRAQLAVAGHSYGAFTALLAAGMRTFSNPPMQMADPRIKAVIAMSPQGPAANRGLTAQSWSDVRVPVMFMTGSLDRGAAETEDAAWRRQAFENSPAGDKYFVLIQGARHSSFTGTSMAGFDVQRPAVMTNPNTQQPANATVSASPAFVSDRNLFQKIKVTSVVFWDAYLKNDAKARDLLQPDKLGSGVELTKK